MRPINKGQFVSFVVSSCGRFLLPLTLMNLLFYLRCATAKIASQSWSCFTETAVKAILKQSREF